MRTRTIAISAWLLGFVVCIGPSPAGIVVHRRPVAGGGDESVIEVDLSNVPTGARILRARLSAEREAMAGDDERRLTNVEIVPAEGGPALKLVGPWYRSFDLTEAVTKAVASGGTELALRIKAFPGWQPATAAVEIAFEGDPPTGLPEVTGARAVHHAGQTFITWKEIETLVSENPTWAEIRDAFNKMDAKRRVRYRIYASDEPVTADSLPRARLLAEVKPLSGFNVNGRSADQAFHWMRKRMLVDADFAKRVSKEYYEIPPEAHDAVVIDRFVIPGSRLPLSNGTGLYVHQPGRAGRRHYAVTVLVGEVESTARPAATGPVDEKPGAGEPVFQRQMDLKVLFDYAGKRLQFVQWTAPPASNLPNQYYNWSVFIPAGVKRPAPLELFFSGNDMFRRPRWPHRPDAILISPHDPPPITWYYGYHESLGTLRSYRQGTIQPYTWRRMTAFLTWAFDEFEIDRGMVVCSGDRGYAATGALHFAMHHPDLFSLVYTCKGMPNPAALPLERDRYGRTIETLTAEMERTFGRIPWGLKTDTGESIWEWFNLTRHIRAEPHVLRPMLSYGGRGQWDWPPIAEFLAVLQETKQPLISEGTWGAVAPPGLKNLKRRWESLAVRNDRPVMVFTHCSSDYQGGRNGDGGATNMDIWWEQDSLVDEPGRFEVVLTGNRITVDVTPRRLAAFGPRPGEKVHYKFTPLSERPQDLPGEGDVTADAQGLITVPQVLVSTKTKLELTRSGS